MGEVHKLLDARGRHAVLALDVDRNAVEAAATYLADDDSSVGYLFSGWTQAALPHKRLADDKIWEIRTPRVTLLVEPGRRPNPIEGLDPVSVGVPYGSRARLIMLYLQSEALRTGYREVELGRSLRAWLTRLGIAPGGKSIRDVREQAERISRCRLTFHMAARGGTAGGLVNQSIVDSALFAEADGEAQAAAAVLDSVKLSPSFFEQLQRHPVPVEEAAIRALSNNSLALDIYCWLAYRLRSLEAPRAVPWGAVKSQFGNGYGKLANFKFKFGPNLALALAVYPEARVDAHEGGLTLHPAKPPVPPRITARTSSGVPPVASETARAKRSASSP